jgi:N-acetylmuramoyl-L-alanine amidase
MDSEFSLEREEFKLRREEFEHRKRMDERASHFRFTPLATAGIAAFFSLLATGVTAFAGGFWTRLIEQEKSERELAIRERDQQFQIILRATEDRTPDEAAENLLFFVNIGYLPDREGGIQRLASQGTVPVFTTSGTINPIADRVQQLSSAPTAFPLPEGYDFTIQNHVLVHRDGTPVSVVTTPSLSSLVSPRYVILHFSATGDMRSSTAWMSRDASNASAHVVIGRDGELVQMAPFDYATWHAGASQWNGLSGLNRYSIGIDMVNWGRLKRDGGGWVSWNNVAVPASEVVELVDDNTGEVTAWHGFTDVQVATAVSLLRALKQHYSVEEVLAHADVSPGRKLDPGPAFPLIRVRELAGY